MRIRTKIALTVCGVAAMSFMAAWFVQSTQAGYLVVRLLSQQHERQAIALGAVAETALATQGEAALAQYVRSLPLVAPNVEYAMIEAADGAVLFHSDPRVAAGTPGASLEARRRALEYASVLKLPDGSSGRALIGATKELARAIYPEFRKSLFGFTLVLAAAGILVSAVFGFGLAMLVAGPVLALARGARDVRGGDLTVQVPVESADEVGELAAQFNAMVVELKALDELKDAFITDVSHDLRSPMAAIKMALDFMLVDDPETARILPRHRQTLMTIKENVIRLGAFVSNILDAAKIKAGRMDVALDSVEIEPIVQRLKGLYEIVAQNQDISATFQADPGLPPATADAERLERALANLLSNAMKFTEAGGRVALSAKASGEWIELSVSDSGHGIASEDLTRLFSRFEQAEAAPRRPGAEGTGLGLFIVKQAVDAMGGEILVESEPKKGTRVVLRLRAAEREPAAAASSMAPALRGGAKILVVDDEPSTADMIRQILETKGYNAAVIHQGGKAAAAAAQMRPDLVLLDMDLGESRGADVIRELKAQPSTASVPIILCSAVMDLPEIQRSLELGAACFVSKPLTSGELDRRIRETLGGALRTV